MGVQPPPPVNSNPAFSQSDEHFEKAAEQSCDSRRKVTRSSSDCQTTFKDKVIEIPNLRNVEIEISKRRSNL